MNMKKIACARYYIYLFGYFCDKQAMEIEIDAFAQIIVLYTHFFHCPSTSHSLAVCVCVCSCWIFCLNKFRSSMYIQGNVC